MENVLEAAIKVAEKNGGKRVSKITLKIGVMSGIVPRYVQSFFDMISKNTVAENAEIIIETDPAVYRCGECGEETRYDTLSPDYLCAKCGSSTLRLLSGYGFQIVSVAIV